MTTTTTQHNSTKQGREMSAHTAQQLFRNENNGRKQEEEEEEALSSKTYSQVVLDKTVDNLPGNKPQTPVTSTTTTASINNNNKAKEHLVANEEYHEELVVHPLANGFVNTYFQFTTRWRYGNKENLHNTRLIPRPIAEILLYSDVKEFHITLTQGMWRYESWGYPVQDAAPGAEAWSWFAGENLTETKVDEQWKRVTSTFSGIICASLNFMDKTNTITPQYGFRPQFVSAAPSQKTQNTQHVRYSSLPREIVCTENLTPWKKLLPCNSRHGFASLLNSGHVHNTNYHSLGIKFRTLCNGQQECILEFTESANMVYDPKLLGSNNNLDFSLRRMFGQGLNGHCALAESSKVYVNLELPLPYEMTPLPHYNITSTRGGQTSRYGVYDIQKLKDNKLFNIAWILRKPPSQVLTPAPPPLLAHRNIVGYGQEKGKIITQITNNYYSDLPIVLQENIPWYMPVYIHTLQIKNHKTGEVIPAKTLQYRPGVQRTRPYYLELAFKIPSKSSVEISLDFDYIFLKWLEYPPDANHGHYVGSSVITTTLPMARNYTSIPLSGYRFCDSFNATRNSYILTLRTESLILSLPTPDFSMPYNVICLACTVVALAFGPIHSVATKKIVVEQQDAEEPRSFMGKIMKKLKKKNKNPSTAKEADDTAAVAATVASDSNSEKVK
ncbi:GPI transamidase component PIG-T [Musca vetustissima]|uniref:GPI transamidase component PIG-T n=1 Tax=Musca vetustissima TaxID=27455 RepID=UPI002AB6BCAE|nr:GPI transamidase component PIG-T [Musca vetustissima]